MNTPQSILIRSVNWLGDAIMSLPAIDRLREAHPEARLTLLTHEKLAGLWSGTDHFDEVHTFAKGESPFTIGQRLREHRFDTALILPNSPRSALECWHANIPRRIGYASRWRKWFLTDAIAPHPHAVPMHKRLPLDIEYRITNDLPPEKYPEHAHHIHQYLHLAKQLGASDKPKAPILHLKTSPSKNTGTPKIGLIAGAEYGPAKRWPTAHFIEAGKILIETHQAHLLLLGGQGDAETATEIAHALPAEHTTNLTDKTTLGELVTTLAGCNAVLTNDTGPMHVAAAVGTPVIVPFGSTSPELTAPGLPGGDTHQFLRTTAPCSPCFLKKCPIDLRCLRDISPAQAAAAVSRVL
ncbi:MAG: lipopolysaccharide heptosyltransferase II [Verrucomicrobia subdivision 3 bacterium]|nr:lipopolysaccharide heptosyltransferase II [Limisphaerales bacterium]